MSLTQMPRFGTLMAIALPATGPTSGKSSFPRGRVLPVLARSLLYSQSDLRLNDLCRARMERIGVVFAKGAGRMNRHC